MVFRSLLQRPKHAAAVGAAGGAVTAASHYRMFSRTSTEGRDEPDQEQSPNATWSKLLLPGDEARFQGHVPGRQLFRPRLPYPAWDYDWDRRMTSATCLSTLATKKGFAASKKGVTRHVLLVRHGQYDETSLEDEKRILTPLGRRQAELTGQRLALLARGGSLGDKACRITRLVVSDMTRAKETADIIASHLPSDVLVEEPDPLLNEALPSPMIPIRPDVSRSEKEIDENHDRIEAAFQKYIHRADSVTASVSDDDSSEATTSDDDDDERQHEFEIIVCHGNVIRYFFCRALQIPPEAWLRLSTFNCSITYLMIPPNGYATARMVGDVGHLPYDDTTFSGNHGFNW